MSMARTPAGDRPGHRVAVEVIVLRVTATGPAYRRRVAALDPDAEPDGAAAALVGGEVAVLHSTSWRRDPVWGLLLTYAALPDPLAADAAAVPLPHLGLAAGADPVRPTPGSVTVHQVAAHALRHLALLRHTDLVVATALAAHPGCDAAVAAAAPVPAGRLG